MNEVAFLKDALLKASDSALRGDILDGLARRYEALGLPDQERRPCGIFWRPGVMPRR